ncbi:hypothetical protein BKA70DRAFT_1435307 [Coprinopsis sp. MPI-PUGE-AT-0042]|nr:hypothetical protein BKA70DRAFT_1435307 [Coprinopsis sp. MPI-PUGE-AT-0042]
MTGYTNVTGGRRYHATSVGEWDPEQDGQTEKSSWSPAPLEKYFNTQTVGFALMEFWLGPPTDAFSRLPPLLLQCSLFLLTLIADFKSWIDSNKALRPHRPNASSIYTHIFRVFNATLMDSLSIAGETVLLEPHPRGTHRVLTHSLRDEIVLYSRTVYAVSRVLFDDFTALPGAHAECHPTFAIIFELLHNSGA